MRILAGTDIIDISRIKNSIEKLGATFLSKVYTADEQRFCDSRGHGRYESYAARFAAKEAVSKALGTGIARGIALSEIEVINNELGKPCVYLHGGALDYYNSEIKGLSIDISLSHSENTAIAFAVILADDK